MLKFKQLGSVVPFNDVAIDKTIHVPIGEWWSVSVPNYGQCDRVAIVECKTNELCEEEPIIGNRSCLRRIDYNNMAWVGILIEDFEDVPPFTLYATDNEGNEIDVFTFEGGTIEDLIDSHDEIEMTPSGVKMYFDMEYANQDVRVSNSDLYLSSQKFCLKKVNKVGVDFSFCEHGCYRLVIYRKDVAIAVSNRIEVVANNDNNNLGVLIEYYQDDFYYRYRLPIYLGATLYETEETEKKLSDGNYSISDSIIRPYVPFKTNLLTRDEHFEILQIIKGTSSLKIGGRMVYFRGAYDAGVEGVDKRYSATGTLYLKELTKVYNSSECGNDGCNADSTFKYEIFEKEKSGTMLFDSANLLSVAAPLP
jgi:hypothetical protein